MSEKAAPRHDRDSDDREALIGFYSTESPAAKIVPASRSREWMDETRDRWAYRCLPLLLANQAGWVILNPMTFTATWTGGERPSAVRIEFADEAPDPPLTVSLFGYGIVTWGVPYLFRTPPGVNLLARGPANTFKDGIAPLEGLVETDWSVATFTMNWKLTRPNFPVTFEAGEPYCMVVPQRRNELESFRPELRPIATDPETAAGLSQWMRQRDDLRQTKLVGQLQGEADAELKWQGDYFRGELPGQGRVQSHQTKLGLANFVRRDQ